MSLIKFIKLTTGVRFFLSNDNCQGN